MNDVTLTEVLAAERQAERSESWALDMLKQLEEAERQPRSPQDDELRPLPSREAIAGRARADRAEAVELRARYETAQAARPLTAGDAARLEREAAAASAVAESRKQRARAAKAHAAALKTTAAELDDHLGTVRAAWQAAADALRELLIATDGHNVRLDVARSWAAEAGLIVDAEHGDGVADGVLTIDGMGHGPVDRRAVLGHLVAAVQWAEGDGGRSAATSTDGRIASMPEPTPTPLALARRKEAEQMAQLREKLEAEREAQRQAFRRATGALPA